jgi:hypothetical protein
MLELLRALPEERYSPRTYVRAATDSTSEGRAKSSGVSDISGECEGGIGLAHRRGAFSPPQYPHLSFLLPGALLQVVPSSASFLVIPRSREVGQSYVTAVWTTLVAFLASFRLLLGARPDLLLVNGPGTCLPLCVAAFLLRLACVLRTRVVFVESVCRVETLSLTGKILYHTRLADAVAVQWPQLTAKYPRAEVVGVLL